MNIKASGRSALIIAAGLWLGFAGPMRATDSAAEPAGQAAHTEKSPTEKAGAPVKLSKFSKHRSHKRHVARTHKSSKIASRAAAKAVAFGCFCTSNDDDPTEQVMNFRPLGDRVLVKRTEEETTTKGGIIIPDTAKEKPQEGEVLAVGPGGRDEDGEYIKMDVAVGDRILFGKWSGTEVKINGDDLIIMKESDILGVVTR